MEKIDEAVGTKAPNKPVDVIKIQDMINNNDLYTGLIQPIKVDGLNSILLTEAISSFQAKHPGLLMAKPDGKVNPGGKTITKLLETNSKSRICKNFLPPGFLGNRLQRFNTDFFVKLYQRQYPDAPLGATARLGLSGLLDQFIADPDITDLRWAAYMLATVKHECSNTWLPIEEYGKGSTREYGKPVAVEVDKKTTKQNTYYGRGYVQLTWRGNYAAFDKTHGLTGTESLELYPENALAPAIAYKVMSYGMRKGMFTGKKLANYISEGGGAPNYREARRIINGTDKALLIAGYAQRIEFLLRFCNGA